MKRYTYILCSILLVAFCFGGCRKMISVKPPNNQLATIDIFTDSASAVAAVLNCYSSLEKNIYPNYNTNIGAYTDEYIFPNSPSDEFYLGNVSPTNVYDQNIWALHYALIYECNDIIAHLAGPAGFSAGLSQQLTGEVKFLRAYAYFYLLNLYGSIPLVLETDIGKTAAAFQSDSARVYDQIVKDLEDAQNDLTPAYRGGARVRANRYAASALLARVYLYRRDWANAETSAGEVIASGLYTPLEPAENVFLANSKETILSFWTQYGYITGGSDIIPGSGAANTPVAPALVSSFESGDLRKVRWIGSSGDGANISYYQYKYYNRQDNSTAPEYLVGLRAAEQYLIRAEARASLGIDLDGAAADLNVVRSRAGLPDAAANTKETLLTAILHERQVELFTEWGHRFLDLKRSGQLNSVMTAYKPAWQPAGIWLPIPQTELTYDHNLRQNPGY